MAEIDAAAVQRIAGVPHMALNVWINRRLIPGVAPTDPGKARLFNLATTLHIATTAALTRLGFGPAFAAMAAAEAQNGHDRPGAKIIVGPPRRNVYGTGSTPTIDFVEAETIEELDAVLDGFVDGRPESYVIVELDRLAARVRQAFAHEADQRARGFVSALRRGQEDASR